MRKRKADPREKWLREMADAWRQTRTAPHTPWSELARTVVEGANLDTIREADRLAVAYEARDFWEAHGLPVRDDVKDELLARLAKVERSKPKPIRRSDEDVRRLTAVYVATWRGYKGYERFEVAVDLLEQLGIANGLNFETLKRWYNRRTNDGTLPRPDETLAETLVKISADFTPPQP